MRGEGLRRVLGFPSVPSPRATGNHSHLRPSSAGMRQLCPGDIKLCDATWLVRESRTDPALFASTCADPEDQSRGLGAFGDAVGQAQEEALGRGQRQVI